MTGRPDQRLQSHQRLIRAREFREAYEQGRKRVGRLMVLYTREGEGAALRLGVVTGRKVGGAVQRTRARRRLRECFRRQRHLMKGDCDIVLIARSALVKAPWDDVTGELVKLCRQAGLME
jgi:ribonuclease P protein component